ncbi:MAG: AgmX/PglI C-terminal domain-containing protein, partial [Gemmatimonadota bacterium]
MQAIYSDESSQPRRSSARGPEGRAGRGIAATMPRGNGGRAALALAASLTLLAAWGCSAVRRLVVPASYDRVSLLSPVREWNEGVELREDGTLAMAIDGLRVEVKYMTDPELNALYPEESSQGRYSTNPYTYGDYVDPTLGHVRNRFTVFRVTVVNINLARVELQPLQCTLTTDRPGESLTAFGVLSGSAPNSFESYYRAIKGASGNEDYRFSMRMGLVRASSYAVGESIYKGEQYEGYITFPALDAEVAEAALHIRGFILKFNAFGKPLETMDVGFRFSRSVTEQVRQRAAVAARAEAFTETRLATASQVLGTASGDLTRDVTAVDGYARRRLNEINDCFGTPFIEGKASEGEISVRFAIRPNGEVEDVAILRSTVGSDEVGRCVATRVGAWRLAPAAGAAASAAPPPRQ